MAFDFSTSQEPLKVFSLAGLTDIVLLLLIFFLLTSSFIPQFGIRVTLPQTEVSAPADEQYVTVSLSDQGQIFIEREEVTRAGLLAALRERKGERTALVLRADEGATVGDFAAVASAAQALDLRVLMATERADRPGSRR